MKINVIIKNDYIAKIPVWFGVVKDGMIWKNGKVDFAQSKMRANIKKCLKDQEYLEAHLDRWAEERGF